MIMSRTPFRISLFGGGTDYPAWYRQHGGAVIGTTVNKYCYISFRSLPPFFEHRHRIVYSRIELPQHIDEIQHPAVRCVLREYGIDEGVEVQHYGDLPARSGMGSSSSFTVGLLNALRAHRGQISSAECLAQEAIRIEQEVIQEAVGSQDQVWAAYGGTNMIRFHTDGRFDVTPITCMHKMAEQAMAILQSPFQRITEIGSLLHESWRLKKELADCVSTDAIDEMYTAALGAGALGGKLLGAGGGGFMLIFAEPHTHGRIREALRGLIEVSFDIGSPGSRIVIYEPNGLGAESQWA